jgi:hypothetical protein
MVWALTIIIVEADGLQIWDWEERRWRDRK